jgi:hypothetical protein
MSEELHELEHIELAKQSAGNWHKFESFGWGEHLEDEDDWYIGYTHNFK